MKIIINVKGLSRKKVIHQEEVELKNKISTTKDLITELVKINVEKFNKKIDEKDILSIMTILQKLQGLEKLEMKYMEIKKLI